jgi:tetratricopeptide (TPR) repeat protein
MTRSGWLVILGCGLLGCPQPAWAHHGPSHVIEELSERIEGGERSAELFVRRGDEYRALGEHQAAVADYESALKQSPQWTPALHGLAQALFDTQQLEAALAVANRGIKAAQHAGEAAPFHALSARIHEQGEQWEQALASWDSALASSRPEVDWFLGQAQVLWRLNRSKSAERALRTAIERNPSEVLRRAWYEALIRCGRLDEAQRQIAAGLRKARWKSTWLLLRARLHAAKDHQSAARRDALAALQEIDQRLDPSSPNPFLVADKSVALALAGRTEEARAQAEIARNLGVPAWKLAGSGPSPLQNQ